MKYTTVEVIPPPIRQYYDRVLLKKNSRIPHERLLEDIHKCTILAEKKYKNCPRKMRKFLELCQDVRKEYGRKEDVKALMRAKKEKERQAFQKGPPRNSSKTLIFRRSSPNEV